jgi:hypothetical protein
MNARSAVPMLLSALLAAAAHAGQIEIHGPAGSVDFGEDVIALPNGNFVVLDPEFSGVAPSAGAVYLYAPNGTLISTLKGSTTNDRIGNWGIAVLANGNFVVRSASWDNGSAVDAGAATYVNGTTGLNATVSAANSLVGTTSGDNVGRFVVELKHGNYLVVSSFWHNGAANGAGAVTWCPQTGGCAGTVSATNSLVGTRVNDSVGGGVLPLQSGDAVVVSSYWNNGTTGRVGAVTWMSGATGATGPVSTLNSLVGTSFEDFAGNGGVVELSNGNYVVVSHWWDGPGGANVGAVTWVPGGHAVSGVISSANSLTGTQTNDYVGGNGVLALANGRYIVSSALWSNGASTGAGAVTLLGGAGPFSGTVTTANSLYGTHALDRIGGDGTVVLANGNVVVKSRSWDNGTIADAGAATWINGATGLIGAVSPANSLVGTTANDNVGDVLPLSNGNYVAISPRWNNGAAVDVGAVTWANGATGRVGAVSSSNSLVGTAGSPVSGRVYALTNGNYVVPSPTWDNGAQTDVGAATWANGATGLVGVVSAANSLIGTTPGDRVGEDICPLANGDYIVASPAFDDGSHVDAGAITYARGTTGLVGRIGVTNSLIGTHDGDQLGSDGLDALPDGRYVVLSSYADSATIVDAGAVTLGRAGGTFGAIGAGETVFGKMTGQGSAMYYDYDAPRGALGVGQGPANVVTIVTLSDALFKNGFE